MTDDPTSPEHLLRIPQGEGEHFDVAGAKLTWKVKSDVTDGRFCFFEMVLLPGEMVPLHKHDVAEAFYVVAGTITFYKGQGAGSAFRSKAGDVAVARPAGLHGFANEGDQPARVLSIGTPEHQRFFDAVTAADRDQPFAAMAPQAAMQRVAPIGAETGAVFAPL